MLLETDQDGISQIAMGALFGVVERTKNLRSHLAEIELTVRSAASPRVAVAAGIGHEVTLSDFEWPPMIVNETTIVLPD